MEYQLEQRELESIEEMEQEHTMLLNGAISQFLTAVIRLRKLPPQPYGYSLDETKTKLIPAAKP